MAQQKNTKKNQNKDTSRAPAPEKKPGGKKKQALTEDQINLRNTVWGIVYAALALISLLSFFDGVMGIVGTGLKTAMSWALGATSVGVPVFFALMAIVKIFDRQLTVGKKLPWIGGLYYTVTVLWSSIAVPMNDAGFGGYLKQLHTEGLNMSGGGVLSGFLAWPMMKLFNKAGTLIILMAGILLLLVIISGITFKSLFARTGSDPEENDAENEPALSGKVIPRKTPEQRKFTIPQVAPEEELTLSERRRLQKEQKKREAFLNGTQEEEPVSAVSAPVAAAKKKADFEFTEELLKTPQQIEQEARALMEQEKESNRTDEPEKMTKEQVRAEEEKVAKAARKAAATEHPYVYPPLSLLNFKPDENAARAREEMKQTAANLMQALEDFSVDTTYLDAVRGPTVTRYELQPNAGVKISKITNLADDIALHLAATGVRIEAPIPGRSAIGIEIPNKVANVVYLKETISSDAFRNNPSNIAVALGKDISGQNVCIDLAKMPHLLIAGSTGSGKSVCINTILMSILYRATPDQVKLILVDPKVVELSSYNGIPHLLIPVVTSPNQAAGALQWAVTEMLDRYKQFAARGVRNYQSFNEKLQEGEKPMSQIVIVIDELADLMMAAPAEVEDAICHLAQMARAAGMHLVIATQRPSADVLTGLIKANVPSRISFAVSSQIDSRIVLDQGGAEKLIGRGDMLYNPLGAPKPMRIQGCFVSDKEVEDVVAFVKEHSDTEREDTSQIMNQIEKLSQVAGGKGKRTGSNADLPGGTDEDGDFIDMGEDVLLGRAVEQVISEGAASTSGLQRTLGVGHARAGRIIDQMEKKGYVGPYQGSKPRAVLITKEEWDEIRTTQAELGRTDGSDE